MTGFQIWNLVVDAGLGISLLFLAYRFIRGGISDTQLQHVVSLESSLKTLLREAELAGSSLNDQLLRRQGSLEGLIKDLDGADQRVKKTINDAQEVIRTTENSAKNARTDIKDLELTAAAKRKAIQDELERLKNAQKETKFVASERVNIYGEPIGSTGGAESKSAEPLLNSIKAYRSLDQEIERESVAKNKDSQEEFIEIEKAVDTVLARSNQLMVESDPRLGVLGAAKRTSANIQE